jgi:preprotein translocase subunit SecD
MKKNRKNIKRMLWLLFFIVLSFAIDWPKGVHIVVPKAKISFEKQTPFVHISRNGNLVDYKLDLKIREGLDLQGGSHMVYSADLSSISEGDKEDAMNSLKKVIESRVNSFGVTEPIIQTSKSGSEYRLLVELAGIKDTEQALDLIGKTANMEFKEFSETEFVSTGITGKDFKKASVTYDELGKPQISIEFNSEGANKFAEVTTRLVGQPLAIYLDDELISAPTINTAILNGSGVITGDFEYDEARELAIQLNAGALPVPVSIIEQRTIGATLGQDSVKKSIIAAAIGIVVVSIYMLFAYRILGIFSTIGLGLYLLFSIALFKIFGITLTMGGIAGLILTIGMSMETDVLVFERIREELRNGRDFAHASFLGFNLAWPSIRDSNAVSLIICALLFTAGGTVRGFAIVFAIGVIIGLITTFFGTRSLIELIANKKFVKNNAFFRVENEESIQ